MKKLLTIIGLSVATLTGANAQTLIGWDFDPLTGGSGDYGPTPFAASTLAANTSSTGLLRNWTPSGSTGAANAWGGNNFNTTTPDFSSAVTNGNFATISLTPSGGYQLSFASINAYNIRRSSSGPTTGQWQYRIGAGSYVDIGSNITWGATTTSAGNAQGAINLSGVTALQNVANTVTFRVVTWGATGSTGTWYFNDPSGSAGNDLVIQGTSTVIPEPTTWMLIGASSAFLLWRKRRRA